MNSVELKLRTFRFSLRVMNMTDALPRSRKAMVLSGQVLRSSTSIGANYRAACRSRSKAEFVSKMRVAEEEADATVYWLELIRESGIIKKERLDALIKEANELTAICTSIGKTTKERYLRKK